jgi:hypothetical protein
VSLPGKRLDLTGISYAEKSPLEGLPIPVKLRVRAPVPPGQEPGGDKRKPGPARAADSPLNTRVTRTEWFVRQKERGQMLRQQRMLKTFQQDMQLSTLELQVRLGLNKSSALYVIKNWRDTGLVAEAGTAEDSRVKLWRRLDVGAA